MNRFSATALTAAACLAGPGVSAESVDLLTDLSVSGSVTANANATEQIQERRVFRDDDEQAAASFGDFPLVARAFAVSPRFEAVGVGNASLVSTRSDNALFAEAELGGEGGFFQFSSVDDGAVTITGGGGASAAFRYDFDVAEAVEYVLTFREEETGFAGFNLASADFVFIDLATGAAIEFDDVVAEPSSFRTTGTGTLLAGSYRLGFEAQAFSDEFSGIRAGFDFAVSAAEPGGPVPIPSPAALPAGVALLCGLLSRRRS